MTQVVTVTEIRIPKSKGKIDNRVVPKRRYVYYFVNALMESVLYPTPKSEIHELSERITDLILKKARALDTVKVMVSLKYCGYVKITDKVIGVYDFVLTIHVRGKVVGVYEIKRKIDDKFFDVEFRVPRKNDVDNDFVNIANFVVNQNFVMPSFDLPNDFVNIANYVMDYVRAYGKERKRRVNDYVVMVNFARFVETLNMFHDSFLSGEITKLIGTKLTYLAYRYLRDSGYFAYVSVINHGGSE
jgi:hypothetical protein